MPARLAAPIVNPNARFTNNTAFASTVHTVTVARPLFPIWAVVVLGGALGVALYMVAQGLGLI